MKKWKAIISAFALSMCAAVTSVGFSEWLIQGSVTKSYGKDADKNARVVAYIQGHKEKFTTIEKAVNFANSLPNTSDYTVVTVPYSETDKNGKKKLVPIVISSSFTINSNVKLLFSFDGEAASTKTPDKDGTYATVTDLSKTSLVNSAVVCGTKAKKVIITNNGTIEIGGELSGGNGGGAYAGHTAGRYAEVVLGEYSSIVNDGGTIDCYGYIQEGAYNASTKEVTYTHLGDTNANVGFVQNKNGKFNLPFVLRDYRGGTSMVAVGNSIDDYHISAFNQIDIRNVTCKISFDYDSKVVGWANLRTGEALSGIIQAQMNSCDIRLIGCTEYDKKKNPMYSLIEPSDPLFSFDAYYNPTTEVGRYDIYGGATPNSMSLSVSVGPFGKTISTENVLFPLSFRQNVILHKNSKQTIATFKMPQSFKVMAGSKIEIEKGVRLEAGTLCVYDENDFIDNASIGGTHYPTGKGDGKLMVNGELSVNVFGGSCLTASADSFVEVKTSASIRSCEAQKQEGSSADINSLKISSTYNIDKTLTLNQLKHINGNSFTFEKGLKVGSYSSIERNNSFGFVTGRTLYNVNYINVAPDQEFDETKTNFEGMLREVCKETSTSLGIPAYLDGAYRYESLYFDVACTKPVSNISSCFEHLNSNNEIDIYVKWKKATSATYDFVYTYVSIADGSEINNKIEDVAIGESGYAIQAQTNCGNYEVLNPEVSKKKYAFVSWILSDDNGVKEDLTFSAGDIIEKSTIEAYDNDGVVKLKAKYVCTNYVYIKVNNKTYKGGWHNLIDYDVIKSAQVTGTQSVNLLKGGAYVCLQDTVKVEVDSSKYANPYAVLSINGKTITLNEGSTTTLNAANVEYATALTNCNAPIVVDAQS